MNEATVEPAPGRMPIRKPTIPPCSMAGVDFLMSAREGMSSRSLLGTVNNFFSVLSSMFTSTSPMAKMPTLSAMNSMPPASSI